MDNSSTVCNRVCQVGDENEDARVEGKLKARGSAKRPPRLSVLHVLHSLERFIDNTFDFK